MDLRLKQLSKRYGALEAVRGVSLELAEGETLALLGPSGCGKSTLLRLIAGLETVDSGTIILGERDITGATPQARGFGMVFQDYALFPHLNVEKNIAFGLAGQSRDAQKGRVGELLELVGLAGYESRRIHELSGGEQQRVALARALAPRPPVLLLDEPLSNLDQSLRETLKRELRFILSQVGIRAVYVTHDQGEAFALSNRIAVMRAGELVQVAPQNELFNAPANLWVARFLGHANLYRREQLGKVPHANAVRAAGAVLRSDLVKLGAGELSATVKAHQVVGGLHQLWLLVEDYALSFRWQGYTRELPASLEVGEQVQVSIPKEAWLELPDEQTHPVTV